eukprot:COSAG05_NODE_232_length_13313_cov_677.565991_5_plen_179_part_00
MSKEFGVLLYDAPAVAEEEEEEEEEETQPEEELSGQGAPVLPEGGAGTPQVSSSAAPPTPDGKVGALPPLNPAVAAAVATGQLKQLIAAVGTDETVLEALAAAGISTYALFPSDLLCCVPLGKALGRHAPCCCFRSSHPYLLFRVQELRAADLDDNRLRAFGVTKMRSRKLLLKALHS